MEKRIRFLILNRSTKNLLKKMHLTVANVRFATVFFMVFKITI